VFANAIYNLILRTPTVIRLPAHLLEINEHLSVFPIGKQKIHKHCDAKSNFEHRKMRANFIALINTLNSFSTLQKNRISIVFQGAKTLSFDSLFPEYL